ncbi:hypothetical protein GF325_05840 [Candidatus Bathyarchaeota archaeon]|nr:hypothetical protein [Candidatus Bathyarchaeota archaeon]
MLSIILVLAIRDLSHATSKSTLLGIPRTLMASRIMFQNTCKKIDMTGSYHVQVHG